MCCVGIRKRGAVPTLRSPSAFVLTVVDLSGLSAVVGAAGGVVGGVTSPSPSLSPSLRLSSSEEEIRIASPRCRCGGGSATRRLLRAGLARIGNAEAWCDGGGEEGGDSMSSL